jgi:hypothetical protein
MIPTARNALTAHPLADIFHPPYPLIASQSISRDVPFARARAFRLLIPLVKGVAEAALYCAHRATTASSWGLCEQEGHLATLPHPYKFACSLLKGSLVDPRLRASNEHILIVRVPRAGGRPGYPPPFSASCVRGVRASGGNPYQ